MSAERRTAGQPLAQDFGTGRGRSRAASHTTDKLVTVDAVPYQEYPVPYRIDRVVELLICLLDGFLGNASSAQDMKEFLLRQFGFRLRLRTFLERVFARAGYGHLKSPCSSA